MSGSFRDRSWVTSGTACRAAPGVSSGAASCAGAGDPEMTSGLTAGAVSGVTSVSLGVPAGGTLGAARVAAPVSGPVTRDVAGVSRRVRPCRRVRVTMPGS